MIFSSSKDKKCRDLEQRIDQRVEDLQARLQNPGLPEEERLRIEHTLKEYEVELRKDRKATGEVTSPNGTRRTSR